jgi:hypothetical protein
LNLSTIAKLTAAVMVSAALGCQQPQEPIGVQSVPVEQSNYASFREPDKPKSTVTQTKTRMIVALFDRDDATWFFKTTGPAEKLSSMSDQILGFVREVKFEDGKPVWKLPADWKEGAKKPMRFATLRLDDTKGPVEMAISQLGPNQDLLLNANRWRKQIGLADVADAKETINQADGDAFYLFDETGVGSGQMGGATSSGAGPLANAPFLQRMKQQQEAAAKKRPSSGIKHDTPDGWEPGKTSSMVPVRLVKKVDEDQLMITIIRMPAAVNKWEPNVVRWAGQVEQTIAAEKIKAETKSITVDKLPGQLIALLDGTADSGIIASMITQGETAWFVKLVGPKAQVEEQAEAFDEFLSSIEF